jgi:hypothetical protein
MQERDVCECGSFNKQMINNDCLDTEQLVQRLEDFAVPLMKACGCVIFPLAQHDDRLNTQYAVLLGLAIMCNKPIITLVRNKNGLSDKIARVSDLVIEWDCKSENHSSIGEVAEVAQSCECNQARPCYGMYSSQ